MRCVRCLTFIAPLTALFAGACGITPPQPPHPLEVPGPVLVLAVRQTGTPPGAGENSLEDIVEKTLDQAGIVVVPRSEAALIEPFGSQAPDPRILCHRAGVSCVLPMVDSSPERGLALVWIRKDGAEFVSRRVLLSKPEASDDVVADALESLSDNAAWRITFTPGAPVAALPDEARSLRGQGESALRRGELLTAAALFQGARTALERASRAASIDQALLLYALGDLASQRPSMEDALLHYDAADRLLAQSRVDGSFLFLAAMNRRAALYLKAQKNADAMALLDRARDLSARLDLDQSPLGAMLCAQLASSYASAGKAGPAAVAFQSARATLKHRGLADTILFLTILEGLRGAYVALGDEASAADTWLEIVNVSKVLILDPWIVRRVSLFDAVILSTFRARGELALTPEEERVLSSYTGAYHYTWHPRWVQARTYEGRLLDTNFFLRDLFDASKTDSQGLMLLRGRFLRNPRIAGAGVTFVDVGPAIANLFSPAATALSIARDFPMMNVVMMDLPEQVDIFKTMVHPQLRASILAMPNVYVLSGNGVQPMASQFADPGRWLGRRIEPAEANGKPLVFRAANSIDIYESWSSNRAALSRIALDFTKSPVLYFFNRTILFKPADSDRFHVVGIISPAGFDHNYETFNRQGDPPYTLSSAALGFQDERPTPRVKR